VYAGPFRLTPSISSPARGGSLTLTINSTEALSAAPVIRVSQPGLASWETTAAHLGGKQYMVTLELDPGGDAGTLELVVSGTDRDGGSQSSTLDLRLR